MDNLNALSTGRKLILGAGALLLVFTFFAWQKVTVDLGPVGDVSASSNAWHGFWGVVLGLLTIVLLVGVAARAFGVELPAGIPDGLTTLVLGVLVFVCALLKNLTDDYSAWASYVGVVLAAVVAYGAWLVFQESGESFPSVSTTGSTPATSPSTTAPEPPAAPTTPSAPPSAPAAPPPGEMPRDDAV
ncbi:MAG TPA: hypothetical protein VLB86_11115 [Gaiellaceae bacterium]|nr:hypothetical protein [Gaiellaceae bacterium]